MDDELMRLFGGEKMKKLMTRIGMEPGEPIYHPWLNKGIERAQRKVEERNFEIRKHLLDYDDVLNEQRTVIYAQRDSILMDDKLAERVMNNAKDMMDDFFNTYDEESHRRDENALKHLSDKIHNTFGMQLPVEQLKKESVQAALQNDLTEKELLAGKENLNMFIRYQYVVSIDRRWLDQLEALESLREGVSLRSYGSKNPLTEYKIDGFNMFDDMMDAIRAEIVSRVFKVRVQVNPAAPRAEQQKHPSEMNAQHQEVASSFNGNQAQRQAAGSAMQRSSSGQSVTVRRLTPKVGRNDPCPCGSGKKYKNCCGRNV